MDKLRHFIIGVILIFFSITELHADGSPVVQSLIVRGDYLFIRVNTGLYTIQEKDGLFYWDFDHEVNDIYEYPDGMVCTLSATNYITDKTFSDFRYFDGERWIEYSYPKIGRHSSLRFFYFEDQCHMIAEEADSEDIVLYVFDGSQWKEETRFPETFRDKIPHTFVREDKLIVDDAIKLQGEKDYYFYLYNFSKKEWDKMEYAEYRKIFRTGTGRPAIEETIYGRGYLLVRKDLNRYGNYETLLFTSPEGKILTLDENTEIAYPLPADIAEDGYCYIFTEPKSHEEEYSSQLWSDRSGDWEVIATGRNFNFNKVVASGSPKFRVWGSNGRTYLAFTRDGKWIELALLPPEADAPDPDGNTGEYEFLLENCDDSEGMTLREIIDPSGNVNVRSQPEAEAPIIAVILKDVPFFSKKIGNGQWSKVLLPSGTVGYAPSNQIQQY